MPNVLARLKACPDTKFTNYSTYHYSSFLSCTPQLIIFCNRRLRIESFKINSYCYKDAKCCNKSRHICQSALRALHSSGERNGGCAGDPLACRELDHIPPQLLDLRDGTCRVQYPGVIVGSSSGYSSAGEFRCRRFPNLPRRNHSFYSSSAGVLISRQADRFSVGS